MRDLRHPSRATLVTLAGAAAAALIPVNRASRRYPMAAPAVSRRGR